MEKKAVCLLCVLVLPAIACGKKEDDLVTGLPGQPPVNFRHYAGYVNLGPQQKQKSLFYWFFDAQQNSSRRPLVLWLNGVTSTRYSLRKMRLKVELPWRSWFHKSQVAGWVETYAGGLTFATVRGAGHQVPLFAPAQSLSLFSHFLSSLPLPSSRF